jgi:putative pyruvate formate lyase activating enzyme
MKPAPGYRKLAESHDLRDRVEQLLQRLHQCDICPRHCGVNRLKGSDGFCRAGRWAVVSSVCDHHGEEPAISGTRGSGAIFLGGCNLRCIYCQNHQISQPEVGKAGRDYEAAELSGKMLALQDMGCHNINWVSPSHYVPQLVEALALAAAQGLNIPVVYNTNGYDDLETLKLLDGIVDIYLPDIRYSSDMNAERYSQASHYVDVSRKAIREMYRQVGNLTVDEDEVALRGLIVRHLILPNDIAGSRLSLEWLSREISPEVTLSVMAQYYPAFKARDEKNLARPITREEYDEVVDTLESLKIENGWLQDLASQSNYRPDFSIEGHPFEKQAND